MSMETQLPNPHHEGTNEKLQHMTKDISDMRGKITSLSVKYGDRNNMEEHITSHSQWGYGNFFPYARSYKHNSYDCCEGNRLGARNGYNDRPYKRVPRNEIRNEGNYVHMDGRFHKRRDDYREIQ
ncbi:hypothetical protein M9H77_18661 [Catharanthus roseus]|uniref:Uncharacterized protein n=1 Tax=Catharanthus roseus TaxID=4058 RepID=A0ACC0B850_CATRO|nr:hypothetical protein M9H77_18661 [Catharanthus roseus]